MISVTEEALPSLLVFGPQAGLPPDEDLQSLREVLINSPHLSDLKNAIINLPELWQDLVHSDPGLNRVPGEENLKHLKEWVKSGALLPRRNESVPNHYALPVTILVQIIQYICFLDRLGPGSHTKVLASVEEGGFNGLCVGFLSALAVASSKDESEIGFYGAIGLRLAVCIGAYIDLDGVYSPERKEYAAVAIRWKEGRRDDIAKFVQSIPDAYISNINDNTSVTVIISATEVDHLIKTALENDFRAKDLHVYGRFHTSKNLQAIDQLRKFISNSKNLEFPEWKKLRVPVRNTADGHLISGGSLTQLGLENVLLNVADWYGTIKHSIETLPKSKVTVAYVGLASCFPSSLSQKHNFNFIDLGSSDRLSIKQGGSLIIDQLHDSEGSPDLSEYPPHSIAIVGMAGRFPGADSVDELWDLIMEKKSTVEPAPIERINLPQTGDYENTKWWGNFLRDPDAFDHKFFKKSSREALAWDPQQRILLEVIYEALESSGYFGAANTSEPLDYGCYIGAVMNNYYDNLSCHPATAYATVGTSRCYLSGCMSHYFGWTGPSLTIDTACSSSLVAINSACRAIWSGECSRAVAGGTNVISSPFDYQNLGAAGFLSPSGQCKPFDADADGYCRGEGVAVVVLKPLSEAIEESDNILGVVVGSAANQNHNFSHITAPYSGSQSELYRKVMKLGGVEPGSVSYVEAHGTGTGVGDPIEVRSITDAFGGPQRDSILHFGSIKGNIGHTEATAGVAGLIKVLLMMRHRKITPQASHKAVNPKIPAFDQQQMAIPKEIIPWEASSLLACINSYGAAGSNSAVILREKPYVKLKSDSVQLSSYPIYFSAGSEAGLSRYSRKILDLIEAQKVDSSTNLLSSLAFNLCDRANHSLSHTFTTSVSRITDLVPQLEELARGSGSINLTPKVKPVVLVFGGQESDFIGLSEAVYQSSTVLRKYLDLVNDILLSFGLKSFYPAIFQQTSLDDLITLHSALFAIQYASAKTWIENGLKVSAVVGHSFGQLTALCVSGSLSLRDAVKLVSGRASLMQKHWGPEPGSMLFLQAGRETINQILQELRSERIDFYAEIACHNGPESNVVVGSSGAIEILRQHISNTPHLQSAVRTKQLNVTNGFHSRFTEPLLPHLEELAKGLEWCEPEIHIETTDEQTSRAHPDFTIVAEHTRQPVFFQQAIERLSERFSESTWIEAGRGSSVIQLVKRSVPVSSKNEFYSPQLTSASKAQESLVDATIGLWKGGNSVQFWHFHRSQRPKYEYLSLPPIQFEKTRHWLGFTSRGVEQNQSARASLDSTEETHELLTFLNFKDSSKTAAVFNIDPDADRFKVMLGGHVMAGQSLAPASLYFEVAARAALFLENDTQVTKYVPTVDDLTMRSPIGQSLNKKILLILKKLDGTPLSWSFSITTQDKEGNFAEPFEHSTGIVSLKRRDDLQAARNFERFETLTGYRRYEEIANHPDAEGMQGNHIYRAFNTVVYYGKEFQGIKQVACLRTEAAGKVKITPAIEDPTDQRVCDTPMTDSFMQFAGFLVNYFNNQSLEDVFVCGKIEHIEIGGDFDPDAGEWLVYSTMSEGGETDAVSDAYVFDSRTKKMVMAAFGFRFSKMSQSLLARMLKTVNRAPAGSQTQAKEEQPIASDHHIDQQTVRAPAAKNPGKRQELLQILSNVTDVPIAALTDESTLSGHGVDSLMATEVLNDIRSVLGLTIDLSEFLFFPNIKALVTHVNEKLGFSEADGDLIKDSESATDSGYGDLQSSSENLRDAKSGIPTPGSSTGSEDLKSTATKTLSITSAAEAFKEVRFNYDKQAQTTEALDFWAKAYPHQARLVLAYVVEAFIDLGCDLKALKKGDYVPQISALKKHEQLVRQLYRVLEDGKLIISGGKEFRRTETPIDSKSAETIYQEIIDLYPQHASVNKLVRAVGSEFAACLRGDKEGIQIVFGNREIKKTLDDMYEFWPLLRTPALVLGDFLKNALENHSTGDGKFRILEIGAGTGGTTRYIVNLLQTLGVDFEYVFTDLGASLVNAAQRQFKGTEGLSFDVLDIEKTPKPEYQGAFHCVIATNCIHATRNLDLSLRNAKKLLRDDGALTLIEITQNMFWLDIVVGLFEGWWLFEDGREHALVNEKHWEQKMKGAGFEEVSWSDGKSSESKTVRVLAAFPTAVAVVPEKKVRATIETVVYKTIGDLDILADIYYPSEGEELPKKKMPIALMIHGGSHILFSRRDVRPAQTQLLLKKGFLPVSLDYRLCPEVPLAEGAMVDVCDALEWAREKLPDVRLRRSDLQIDGEQIVVVGWSSGGQLAMSLAWTAPSRGLPPPAAILSFYAPTDYEDVWWQNPIHPNGAPYKGQQYDVLDGVRESPIARYDMIGAWEEPIADPRSQNDARCRIVLHINWKAQTLPVILNGLPSKKASLEQSEVKDWNSLPQPSLETIKAASPRDHIRQGTYNVPTFLIHGTADDLIPWQQSQGTYQTLVEKGIDAELVLLPDAPHICDLSNDPKSDGWKATVTAYEFISSYVA